MRGGRPTPPGSAAAPPAPGRPHPGPGPARRGVVRSGFPRPVDPPAKPKYVPVRPDRFGGPPPAPSPMPAVRFRSWHHTSLAVRDLDVATAFYRDAFGYELLFRERGMSRQIASMTGIDGLTCDLAQLRSARSDHLLELIAFHPPPPGAAPQPEGAPLRPGAAHVAFAVEDLDAALASVEALGAARLGRITEFSEGRSVYCREPAGSFFEMEELRETPAAGVGAGAPARRP